MRVLQLLGKIRPLVQSEVVREMAKIPPSPFDGDYATMCLQLRNAVSHVKRSVADLQKMLSVKPCCLFVDEGQAGAAVSNILSLTDSYRQIGVDFDGNCLMKFLFVDLVLPNLCFSSPLEDTGKPENDKRVSVCGYYQQEDPREED